MRQLLSLTAFLGLLAVGATDALAQTQTLPSGFDTTEASSSTGFPFSSTARHKWHWVYDSSNFTQTFPIRITAIEVRANANVATRPSVTFNNLDVKIGPSANDYVLASQSTTFAANWVGGAEPATSFFTGNLTTTAGSGATSPSPWGEFVITGQNPVLYDPTLGQDLIIQVRTPANGVGTTNPLWAAIDGPTGGAGVVRGNRYGHTTDPDALVRNFQNNEFVPVVRIHYTPAAGLYANFNATPTSGASPLNVQFTDATFTSDPGGVTSWAWDLDGDNLVDSNAQNPAFTYNTCGRYNVSLTVTDASNPQSSITRNQFITVDPQLLVSASFTVTSTGALSRQFTDTSVGSPSVWSWDLDGDNIPDSAAQNPSFTYPTGGTYTVTLNASNACGASTVSRQVVVITNDDCVGATPVVTGTNGPFSNVGASSSGSFTCGGTTDSDVWFSYTPTCNVQAVFSTCQTNPSFDTKISVHSGACGALTQLTCNDDAGAGCGVSTLLSRTTAVAMTGGQTYYIAVGGFNGASGTFLLDVVATAAGAGSFTTVSPGCGGTGLTASGNPNIGGSANFTMAPVQGLPLINLGIIPLGIPICAGGCVLGATLDATFPGATFGGAIPCDPLLIGATVYTQGIDIGAVGGCAAGDPLVLTLSDTIRTIIG
jgi:PKD repeat protein